MYEQEEWRPVPGCPGYEASSLGRIRLVRGDSPRIVPQYGHRSGHLYFCNYQPGVGQKTATVHSAVAEAFHGARPQGAVCRHLDGDPKNNRPGNIAWGTPSENEFDKVRHGVHPQASQTHCSKGHVFDAGNTYVKPSGHRDCRTCIRSRVADYKVRKQMRAARIEAAA